MKTRSIILLLVVAVVCGLLFADPNDPNGIPVDPYNVNSLRPLTAEEVLALKINGTTFQQAVDLMMDRQVGKAKRKYKEMVTYRKTLLQLQIDVNDLQDPNK